MSDQPPVPGARSIEEPPEFPPVKGVTSNRTVYIAALNPKTAGQGGQVELVDAPTVAAAARALRPSVDCTLEDVRLTPEGGVRRQEAACRLEYGADAPELILDDFTAPANVAKVVRTAAEPGASEIVRRPLLAQRLASAWIEDLLRQLREGRLDRAVTDPEVRRELTEALAAEVERVRELITRRRRRAALARAAGEQEASDDDA